MAGTLIVALDVEDRRAAEDMVETIGDKVDFYKIGYQLVYGGDGLNLAKSLLAAGKRVFLDLKLLDIDNTVEKAIEAIARTGVTMTTVHAYPRTMRAAAAAAAAAGSDLTILGVTVLTSMDDGDLTEAGYGRDVSALAALRARQAREIGIGGVVASPLEAEMLRAILGPDLAIVTPGIRPEGAGRGDQKRVSSPRAALAAGASHLVVGRAITHAVHPAIAADLVLREMAS